MSLHDLFIPSENQRKVRLKEIMYCRGSQHLSCFVETLTGVVSVPQFVTCKSKLALS